MTSRSQLRLERKDALGEPGALVAAWLMGELLSFASITVQLIQPNEVVLEARSHEELRALQLRIAALLNEPRFACWAFEDG